MSLIISNDNWLLQETTLKMINDLKIAVIGLGYVGLPLAVRLAENYSHVIGFDISQTRVAEIKDGHDRTDEITSETLRATSLIATTDANQIANCNLYIVCVPTPVDSENQPDLKPLQLASETVALYLNKGDIVVFESTVYPGITEDYCGKILAERSGFMRGQDFYLGYSPERINPGDRINTIANCTKVVSGENEAVTELLATIYGSLNNNNIFKAASIKVAEAAKVIENAQRDINIAFINEVATIFSKMNISVYDVLATARTKWNFINFAPGLVGGHCIGVDPFYLAECSMKVGHVPKVILAGREINDQMAQVVATRIEKHLKFMPTGVEKRILILGITFKENVPDIRNTKVIDVVSYYQQRGYTVDVHDPHASPQDVLQYYNIHMIIDPNLSSIVHRYIGIIAAVPHQQYLDLNLADIQRLLVQDGLVADIKGIWRHQVKPGDHYWSL